MPNLYCNFMIEPFLFTSPCNQKCPEERYHCCVMMHHRMYTYTYMYIPHVHIHVYTTRTHTCTFTCSFMIVYTPYNLRVYTYKKNILEKGIDIYFLHMYLMLYTACMCTSCCTPHARVPHVVHRMHVYLMLYTACTCTSYCTPHARVPNVVHRMHVYLMLYTACTCTSCCTPHARVPHVVHRMHVCVSL